MRRTPAVIARKALCLVLGFIITGSAAAQVNVDSLEDLLTKENRPLERLTLLREMSISRDLVIKRQYADATIHYSDSLLAHGFAGDTAVLARKASGLFHKGKSLERSARDSAIIWYRKSIAQYEAIGRERAAAGVRSHLYGPLMGQGDARAAIGEMRSYLLVFEELHDTMEMASGRLRIGQAYSYLGDQSRALDEYLIALRLAHHVGEAALEAACMAYIGAIYEEQGQLDTALVYYQRAIPIGKAGPFKLNYTVSVCSIMKILSARGKNAEALRMGEEIVAAEDLESSPFYASNLYSVLGTIHRELGHDEQALHFGELALSAAEQYGFPQNTINALTELGRTLHEHGKNERALKHAMRARALCDAGDTPLADRAEVADLLSDIHESLGSTDKALSYYREFVALNDSIKGEKVRKKLALMDLRKQETADSLRAAKALQAQAHEHNKEMDAESGRKRLFMYGGLGVFLLAGGLWWRLSRTRRDKKRSEEILYNVLPEEVAKEIKETGAAKSREFDQVSVLFTDFKGFTELSATMPRQELMAEIDACFMVFDEMSHRHGVEKIKTIGDAYMAAAGLKGVAMEAAVNTVRAACEMQHFIEARYADRNAQGLAAFRMRVGIHTGPVVAGIVGVKKFQYDIWGDTVNTASRMESSGAVGHVNISEATYALVKDVPGLRFTPRGKVQAKGKGEMEMYFVTSDKAAN